MVIKPAFMVLGQWQVWFINQHFANQFMRDIYIKIAMDLKFNEYLIDQRVGVVYDVHGPNRVYIYYILDEFVDDTRLEMEVEKTIDRYRAYITADDYEKDYEDYDENINWGIDIL